MLRAERAGEACMLLRYAADRRTILWTLITPAVVAAQYVRPDWIPYLCWVSCYFALACGVIAHNHNHCQTFTHRWLNTLFGYWISIFYGYPVFAWVPTHNMNHHKFTNREGDATITWRVTNRHNLWMAVGYFFMSAYYQSGPIKAYIREARANKPRIFRQIISNYVIWIGTHVAMAALGVALYGPWNGLAVWFFSMGLPAFFALWTIMLFNYEQHVHADPDSKYNHSRNFSSRSLNFLLFNNGYHTVHHEQPGLHWSKAPEAHAAIAAQIDPSLIEDSVWWYWLRQYFVAPFLPNLGTKQLGAGPPSPMQRAPAA
jgi:fatty acid desaturase